MWVPHAICPRNTAHSVCRLCGCLPTVFAGNNRSKIVSIMWVLEGICPLQSFDNCVRYVCRLSGWFKVFADQKNRSTIVSILCVDYVGWFKAFSRNNRSTRMSIMCVDYVCGWLEVFARDNRSTIVFIMRVNYVGASRSSLGIIDPNSVHHVCRFMSAPQGIRGKKWSTIVSIMCVDHVGDSRYLPVIIGRQQQCSLCV